MDNRVSYYTFYSSWHEAMELLEPVLKEMHTQGKLAFLPGTKQEPVDG